MQTGGGQAWNVDNDRVKAVVLKLARGHGRLKGKRFMTAHSMCMIKDVIMHYSCQIGMVSVLGGMR